MSEHYRVMTAEDGGVKVTGPSQFHVPLTIYAKDRMQAEVIAYAMNQAYEAGLAAAAVIGARLKPAWDGRI